MASGLRGATCTYQSYSDLELWGGFQLTQANQNSSLAKCATRRLQQDLGGEEGGPEFLQDTQGPPVRARSTAWQPRSSLSFNPQTKTLKLGPEKSENDGDEPGHEDRSCGERRGEVTRETEQTPKPGRCTPSKL